MANYATLKAAIQQVVKTNGNNEITGELLQQSLLAMINSLGAGYQFVGVASPSTNPGNPDYNVFYIAATPGTYSNFGGAIVPAEYIGILKGSGSTWTLETIKTAPFSADVVLDDIIQLLNTGVNVYPRTKAEAVFFDDDTTKTLNKVFGDLANEIGTFENLDQYILSGKYAILYNENQVSINDSVNYDCGVIPCQPGDVFYLTTYTGANQFPWGFRNSNGGNVLSSAANAGQQNNILLVAPPDATTLYVNLYKENSEIRKSKTVENRITELENKQAEIMPRVGLLSPSYTVVTGKYANKNSGIMNVAAGRTTTPFNVKKGDVIKVIATGFSNISSIIFSCSSYSGGVWNDFNPLVNSIDDNEHLYQYTAPFDMLIAVSYRGYVNTRFLPCEIMVVRDTSFDAIEQQLQEIAGNYDYELNWIDGGYIYPTTGVVTPFTGWKYTDFIQLKKGYDKLLIRSNVFTTPGNNAFYDKDYNFISNFEIGESVSISVPDNAVYFRLSNKDAGVSGEFASVQLVPLSEKANISAIPEPYIPDVFDAHLRTIHTQHIIKSKLDFNGKKILCFGDSIIYGAGSGPSGSEYNIWTDAWVRLFAAKTNATLIMKPEGGACYTTGIASYKDIPTQVNEAVADSTIIPDVIFIAAGTNDWGHNAVIGNMDDNVTTTLYGSLNYVISTLKTAYPDIPIVIIIPINRTNIEVPFAGIPLTYEQIVYFDNIRNAIFNKAIENDLFVVDGSKFAFPLVRGAYQEFIMYDGVHPTKIGHRMYFNTVYQLLQL